MTGTLLYSAAVLAVIASAAARDLPAQELDTVITVRQGARLVVSNQSGSVSVRPGGARQIRVQAEYERAQVEIDGGASRVAVRTVARRGHAEVDYEITVPGGTPIEVNGISTDVDIVGVCGEVVISVISGDVNLSCGAEAVRLQTVSGDVSVSDVRGSLEVSSTSGDVEVFNARGPVSAHTVSGDVSLTQIDADYVSAETVSGEIEYGGPLLERGRYRFEAHSGDVTLHMTGTLNATFTVSTYSGDFDTDFPIVIQPGARVGSKEWEFVQGNGSARVTVRSFSGTIYLRRGAGGGRGRED